MNNKDNEEYLGKVRVYHKKRKKVTPEYQRDHPLHQPYRRPTKQDWMNEEEDSD